PYGEPKYVELIKNHIIDLKPDGTFRLNMDYFNYAAGLTMTNDKFAALFGGPARKPETQISQKEMDLAASIQVVTEEVVLKLCQTVKQELDVEYLCLAGGVALNCVANGKILRANIFKDIWIQPAAGDAGGALGAALATWYQYLDNPRDVNTFIPAFPPLETEVELAQTSSNSGQGVATVVANATNKYACVDAMKGSYLGPKFQDAEIRQYLDSIQAQYEYLADEELMPRLAEILEQGNVVGWFQGRMEFGPRALGGRSIIGDPRNQKMQSVMNLKIKYRESFRPFAPSVLAERVAEYFDMDHISPYMLLVAPVDESRRIPMTPEQEQLFGIEKLKVPRSELPSITHVDYSARIQTIHPETNPRYYALVKAFDQRTGCPVIVNTSFNVRGEPIVSTPEDAYRCFMRTEMDYLVVENFLMAKTAQTPWEKDDSWQSEFELD
ncbi:MAG: carbamoyltransferase family protein, partial [Microcoleaceae cyanobacterium]